MAPIKRRPRGTKTTKTTTESVADLLAFSLGANVGDCETRLLWAIDQLRELYGPVRIAPLYRTEPISPIAQEPFLNTVVLADLPAGGRPGPRSVLDRVKALEEQAGRAPGERYGPRPLDVDLLLFGDLVCSEPDDGSRHGRRDLTLPHPRMRQRRFVLAPLHDLAPGLRLPPDNAMVNDLLAALGSDQVVETIDWSPG